MPIASAAITATFFGKFTKSNWILESKPRVLDKVLDIRVGFPFPIASAAFTAIFFHFYKNFFEANRVLELTLRELTKAQDI